MWVDFALRRVELALESAVVEAEMEGPGRGGIFFAAGAMDGFVAAAGVLRGGF